MNSVISTSSSSGYREQIDTTGPLGRAVVVIVKRHRRTGTYVDC